MKKTVFAILFSINISTVYPQVKLLYPSTHESEILSFNFSKDGNQFLTTSDDRSIKLWDIRFGVCLKTFSLPRVPVSAIFGNNSSSIFYSTDSATYEIDIVSGEEINSYENVQGYITLSNSNLLAGSGYYYETSNSIMDLNNGESIHSFNSDTEGIIEIMYNLGCFSCGVFSALVNEKYLIYTNMDNYVHVYDYVNGIKLSSIEGLYEIATFDVDKKDARIFIPGDDWLKVHALDGSVLREYKFDQDLGSPYKILYDEVNNRIYWGSDYRSIYEINLETGEIIRELINEDPALTPREGGIVSLGLSNGSTFLVAGYEGQNYYLKWDLRTGEYNKPGLPSTPVNSISVDNSSKQLGCVTDKAIYRVNLSNLSKQLMYTGEDFCGDVDFIDSRVIVGSKGVGKLELFDLEGAQLQEHWIPFITGEIKSMAGNEVILVGDGYPGDLALYNLETEDVKKYISHDGNTISNLNTKDAESFFTSGGDGKIKHWRRNEFRSYLEEDDFNNQVELYESSSALRFGEKYSLVEDLEVNSTGDRLAICGEDRLVIWDYLGNNTFLDQPFKGISSVLFLSSRYLLAGDNDGKIFYYDLVQQNKVSEIKISDAKIIDLVPYSTGNTSAIALSEDNSIIFIDSLDVKAKILSSNDDSFFIYTPDGYYFGTKDFLESVFYEVDSAIISFDQLDMKFNRPDKVLKAIGSEDKALIDAYEHAYYKRIKKLDIDTSSFNLSYDLPGSNIVNQQDIPYVIRGDDLTLELNFFDSVSKLERFNLFINESPVFGSKGINLRDRKISELDTTVTVTLSNGDNWIEPSAMNDRGLQNLRSPLIVTYQSENKTKAKTYFVGIGIDHFEEPNQDLNYSVKDIRDLADRFSRKYGKDVQIDTLFDRNVTREKIFAIKDKLLKTDVDDKVIVAYSGHGLLSEELEYYLSTYTVNFSDPSINGLPYETLEDLLDSIPSRKKLLLIDACHSGEVDKDDLELADKVLASNNNLKEGQSKGAVGNTESPVLGTQNTFELMQELFVNVSNDIGATVISAAGGTQFAYERGDLSNGVFTYTILKFMEENESFTVQELKKYVSEEVERITQGAQKPTSRLETSSYDWVLWE